jgi:hypothetical protein
MKRNPIFIFFFLLIVYPVYSQDIINSLNVGTNESIHQISTNGIADILSFQTLNRGTGSFVLIQQTGNQNTSSINQQSDPGQSNQSYAYQQGSFNEMSVGQIGSSNLLLGFQLGYLANEVNSSSGILPSISVTGAVDGGQKGDGNVLEVSQEGENNGIMAVQQGNDNSILAEQKGTNNYLLILQKGTNNSVIGYIQESSSGRNFDTIIQDGESLSLDATGVSTSKAMGNIFSQSGTNLSLQVNNGFVNSIGGIEITQTGKDMNVVVDQSYFSLPLK